MTDYFKPRFGFFCKTVSAVLLMCLFVSPALAGRNDARWDPPARYAGPYNGQLTIHRLDPSAVKPACTKLLGAPYASDSKVRGCALMWTNPSRCIVVIIDRPAFGTTPEAVLTHEIGHCRGWSADHSMEEGLMGKLRQFFRGDRH